LSRREPEGSGRQGPSWLRRAAAFAAGALACACFAATAFLAILSLWGVVAAPFVRLRSASFVIACALAGSVAATVAAWRAALRLYRRHQVR